MCIKLCFHMWNLSVTVISNLMQLSYPFAFRLYITAVWGPTSLSNQDVRDQSSLSTWCHLESHGNTPLGKPLSGFPTLFS